MRHPNISNFGNAGKIIFKLNIPEQLIEYMVGQYFNRTSKFLKSTKICKYGQIFLNMTIKIDVLTQSE